MNRRTDRIVALDETAGINRIHATQDGVRWLCGQGAHGAVFPGPFDPGADKACPACRVLSLR